MQRYSDVVQDLAGNTLPGATVTVLTSGGAVPTLYAGANGTLPYASNVLTTGVDGKYSFYAANGVYTLTIAATGFNTDTRAGTVLFDPTDALTANFNVGGFRLTNVGTPSGATDGATKGYVDTATAVRSMGGYQLNNVGTPAVATDAATKGYVDGITIGTLLPVQTGNGGRELVTDGTSASWGISAAGALAILNFIGY